MALKNTYITPRIGGRQLIISDIHGCSNTFKNLIRKIELQKNDQLILLGDLINKGPNSKEVIDYILALKEEGFEVYVIRGNNESLLLNVLKKSEKRIERLSLRFRVTNLFKKGTYKLKKKYKKFLKSTYFYIESDHFFAVHAGFDFSSKEPFKDFFQMLWMRNFKPDETLQNAKCVIYGHRIFPYKKIKTAVKNQDLAIPLDNGCILRNTNKNYGRLVCYDFTNKNLITQRYSEDLDLS
jgi:serine/threonine protein phosphatase 1